MSNKKNKEARRQHEHRQEEVAPVTNETEAPEAVEAPEIIESRPEDAYRHLILEFTFGGWQEALDSAERTGYDFEDIYSACNVSDRSQLITADEVKRAVEALEAAEAEPTGPGLGERIRGTLRNVAGRIGRTYNAFEWWIVGNGKPVGQFVRITAIVVVIASIMLTTILLAAGYRLPAWPTAQPTAEPTAVTAIVPTTPTIPTVQTVAVVPTVPVSPAMAITTTAPVTSTVIDTITATVTITVPVEVEPVVTVTPTTAITGTLENAPEELTLLYLVREDKVVADADVSDEGAFSFGGIPDGNYDLKTKGLVTPVTVEVREGKPISELSLHNVVEGDTLWEMYRGGTWERFEEMAKELGLKWFVNDGGTPDDTTDDLLVVIIQPGQVFDLGWAPSA